MNNVTIGGSIDEKSFAYYETIGGGMGARYNKDGIDGVHMHMSNSGGKGKYRGGLGISRSIQVLTDCTVSIQSERRKFAPYGLFGGEEGRKGRNILMRKGRVTELPSKTTYQLLQDDIIRIETPGDGGYGSYNERSENLAKKDREEERVI